MKVVFTDPAIADLENVRTYTRLHFPSSGAALERRFRTTLARIAQWPESAEQVPGRPGVRVVPLSRYPFRIFYRIEGDTLEVLHVHHTAQQLWE